MGSAHRLPQERARCAQVRSTTFLECESGLGEPTATKTSLHSALLWRVAARLNRSSGHKAATHQNAHSRSLRRFRLRGLALSQPAGYSRPTQKGYWERQNCAGPLVLISTGAAPVNTWRGSLQKKYTAQKARRLDERCEGWAKQGLLTTRVWHRLLLPEPTTSDAQQSHQP
jgi:hypothetical protein